MNDLYEKKYKEALEKAREIYKEDFKAMWLKNLFPELKENEDEKIRKQILSFLKEFECDHYRNLDFSSWIAWLEKQGECVIDCPQNHQDSNRPSGGIVLEDFNGGEGFYKLNLAYLNKKQVEEVEEMVREWNDEPTASEEDIKDCIGMCLTDADEQRFKNYHTNLRDCLAWLEKQGVQKIKHSNEENYEIDGLCYAKTILKKTLGKVAGFQTDDGILEHKSAITAVEKLCEQKPTDAIEPKFKVGDWVVFFNNHRSVYQIEKIENYQYTIRHILGGSIPLNFCNEDSIRLWTIADAEDGDILNCNDKINTDCPFIFHNLNEESNPRSYCGVNTLGLFQYNDENNRNWCKSSEVKPATKEQRDLLFQKMKEEGYEWDAEKKKLNKKK